MSTEWLVYTTVVPALLAAAGLAAERLLRLYGRPVRYVWALALGASVLSAPVALAWSRTHVEGPVAGAAIEPSEALAALLATPVEPEATWRDALPSVPDAVDRAAGAGAILASLLMLSLLTATLLRLRWERRRWTRERVEEESVLVSGALGPAVVGVVRPAIVLPRWLLSESSPIRRLALAHEREHVRAGDTRMLMLGCVAVALAPWSPALWWQVRRLRLAIEMDCDRRVLRAGAAPDEYGAMLLGVAARRTRTPAPALALLHPPKMIERRILAMTESMPRHRILRAAGLAAASVFIVALACDVPPPTEPVPPSEGDEAVARASTFSVSRIDRSEEPLFVVDGVIVSGSTGWITELDDIESVEVVKGETARALYGERARHGLIVVTTSSGAGRRMVEGRGVEEVAMKRLMEQEVALERAARENAVRERVAYTAAQKTDRAALERELAAGQAAGVLRKVDEAVAVELRAAREREVANAVVAVPLMKDRVAQVEAAEVARRQALEVEAVARVKVPLRATEVAIDESRPERAARALETTRAELEKVEAAEVLVERAARVAEVAAIVESKSPRRETIVVPREGENPRSVLRRASRTEIGRQPIYVVDGVILGPGRLDFDALDIESVEVVKGEAAEKLYGTRGRYGVIRITTKK